MIHRVNKTDDLSATFGFAGTGHTDRLGDLVDPAPPRFLADIDGMWTRYRLWLPSKEHGADRVVLHLRPVLHGFVLSYEGTLDPRPANMPMHESRVLPGFSVVGPRRSFVPSPVHMAGAEDMTDTTDMYGGGTSENME